MEYRKENYSFEDFVRIIEKLRAKDGCPWDREQTHDSLRPCMMEEAAELVSSIRIYHQTGSAENMREELGDILLQVVMHSVIAEEENLFTLEDVIKEVSEKMIRRHPHIFGTVQVENAQQVLQNWDEIKKKEKEGKDWIESPLREIPPELPALTRGTKVLKKIDKLYEPAPSCKETVESLREAVEKLAKCSIEEEKEQAEKLLGDILLDVCEVARRGKIPAEQLLNDRIEDLIDAKEGRG